MAFLMFSKNYSSNGTEISTSFVPDLIAPESRSLISLPSALVIFTSTL